MKRRRAATSSSAVSGQTRCTLFGGPSSSSTASSVAVIDLSVVQHRQQRGRHRLGADVPAVVDGHRDSGIPSALPAHGRPRELSVHDHGGGDGRRPRRSPRPFETVWNGSGENAADGRWPTSSTTSGGDARSSRCSTNAPRTRSSGTTSTAFPADGHRHVGVPRHCAGRAGPPFVHRGDRGGGGAPDLGGDLPGSLDGPAVAIRGGRHPAPRTPPPYRDRWRRGRAGARQSAAGIAATSVGGARHELLHPPAELRGEHLAVVRDGHAVAAAPARELGQDLAVQRTQGPAGPDPLLLASRRAPARR